MLLNFHVETFRVQNISHKWTVCKNISQNNLYTYSEIVKHGGVLLVFEATTDKEAAGGEELACEREPHSTNDRYARVLFGP